MSKRKASRKIRVWLCTTNDKYELPLAVADSCIELAKQVGVKPTSISEAISRYKKEGKPCRYKKVIIEEED